MRNALLDELTEFVGYGSETPDYVFIGIEEWTRDATEARYKTFVSRTSIIDLHENKNTREFVGDGEKKRQKTWWPICTFLLAVEKDCSIDSISAPEILDYQRNRLGRANSNHLLTELFPVPKLKSSVWPEECEKLFGFQTLSEYHSHVWQRRCELLHKVIRPADRRAPKCVLCYGKSFWHKFNEVAQSGELVNTDKPFIARSINGTQFIFTHHPNSRSSERFNLTMAEKIRLHVAENTPSGGELVFA